VPVMANEVDVEVLLKAHSEVESAAGQPMQARGFRPSGGEEAGLSRLRAYCERGLASYHRTRNQLWWDRTGSCLSPWLAHGCLSPRTVYAEVQGSGAPPEATFKLFFELCWRDMFRFYCAFNGSKVFFKGGPAKKTALAATWKRNIGLEQAWREGRTGEPLVDAIMTELKETGFATNRARYVVAWFLVHKWGLDWRVGADWFEHVLIDHDVCSNYGEWASMANVACGTFPLGLKGRGPRTGTQAGQPWASGVAFAQRGRQGGSAPQEAAAPVFEPHEQAMQYDKDGTYVRMWLGDAPRGTPAELVVEEALGASAAPPPKTPKGVRDQPKTEQLCKSASCPEECGLPGEARPKSGARVGQRGLSSPNSPEQNKSKLRKASSGRRKPRVQGGWSKTSAEA